MRDLHSIGVAHSVSLSGRTASHLFSPALYAASDYAPDRLLSRSSESSITQETRAVTVLSGLQLAREALTNALSSLSGHMPLLQYTSFLPTCPAKQRHPALTLCGRSEHNDTTPLKLATHGAQLTVLLAQRDISALPLPSVTCRPRPLRRSPVWVLGF